MIGGLGSIEGSLQSHIYKRFLTFKEILYPHLYPLFDMDTTKIMVVSRSLSLSSLAWEILINIDETLKGFYGRYRY